MANSRNTRGHVDDRRAQWGSPDADAAVSKSDNLIREAQQAINAADMQLRALKWFLPHEPPPRDK